MNAALEFGTRYKVELEVFEGPLDLLLHLVKKHELDILDIPIAFVTEKYLQYLDMMEKLNLDVAGEYLLMAATLAYIKSRELLPPEEGVVEEDAQEEEGNDPREELIRRLLEYQKYKDAATNLGERPVVGRNVWTRGAPQLDVVADNIDADSIAPLASFPVHRLVQALDRIMKRAKISMTHKVITDRLSLGECINQLSDRLQNEERFTFESCFRFLREEMSVEDAKHEAVITFLAMLEMAKLGILRVEQALLGEGDEEAYDDLIYLVRGEGQSAALSSQGDAAPGLRSVPENGFEDSSSEITGFVDDYQ